METVAISIFEPQMPIVHDKGKLYHTGLENGTATISRAGFADLVIGPVTIPPTPVTRELRLKDLPTVATVAACVNQINAPTTFTDPRDGAVFTGTVNYPACPVDLFGGGASSLTAMGTLTRVL